MTALCEYDLPATFVKEEFRIARKQHSCSECGCIIDAGEEYAHIAGMWEGEFSVFKQCTSCWGLFWSLVDAGWCPEYGGMHEVYAEYLDYIS